MWTACSSTRHYTLDGKSITPGFHVEESVWKRDMPSQHTVEILFLCGTDVIRTTFVVPVNNYTDAGMISSSARSTRISSRSCATSARCSCTVWT